jgi:hypothetical protein
MAFEALAFAGMEGPLVGTGTEIVNGMSVVHDDPLEPHDFTCSVWLPPGALTLAFTAVPLTMVVDALESSE